MSDDTPRRADRRGHGRRTDRARPASGPAPDHGPRPPGLDGILLVRKPIGPTSHDVVATVRRLSGTRRVGHGGTLDPFASGLLPVYLGQATRLVEYHMGDRKRYRATACFGATSTTDDLEGELTPAEAPAPDEAAVRAALAAFRGPIVQVPPAYSAVKVAGRRAYALARAGKTPELAPRSVTIGHLEVVEWDGSDPDRPIAVLEVECSAGTYVRALARDLGAALGCGAYLGALERTGSGPWSVDGSVALDDLRDRPREAIVRRLLPVDAGLDAMPSIRLDAAGLHAVERGQRIRDPRAEDASADETVRLVAPDGSLVAMGRPDDGWISPVKVLRPAPGGPGRDARQARDA